MLNYCKTIGALAAASALVAGNAQAEVEYEMHTGYSTLYLFRGVESGNDMMEAGIDAATEMNGFSLSGGVWTGVFEGAADRESNDDRVEEVDLYVEAAKDFGFATVSLGYIYYWNVEGFAEDNQEIYLGLSRDLGFATVSLTSYWDVDRDGKGDTEGYTELGLSRSFELSPCLTLNIGTNVGYLIEDGEFTAWATKASLDWGFAERAKLSPFAAVSLALGEADDTAWETVNNELTVGSMLSVSF